MVGDARDAGAGDCEGAEGEDGARREEGRGEAEGWVSTGLIRREIAFEWVWVELALDVARGRGVRGWLATLWVSGVGCIGELRTSTAG